MARIRSIKPEFFRHEDLYEAEKETGLPLRVAFAGLWTAADREGRFKWAPKELKLDCLPFDDVDFAAVLDALEKRGFVRKYQVQGKTFGCIPSWKDHQHINQREAQSKIPAPPEQVQELHEDTPIICTHVHAHGEGKGKEGKDAASDDAHPAGDEKDLFRRGKDVLGKDSGGLIAKLLKSKSGSIPLARAAIEQAATKENPREYVGRAIAGPARAVTREGNPYPEGII